MSEYCKNCYKLAEENEELKEKFKQITFIMEREKYPREKIYLDGTIEKMYKCLKALEEIKEIAKKYDAKVGDTIIANPIQDLYDIYNIISEVENER